MDNIEKIDSTKIKSSLMFVSQATAELYASYGTAFKQYAPILSGDFQAIAMTPTSVELELFEFIKEINKAHHDGLENSNSSSNNSINIDRNSDNAFASSRIINAS
jgi:hypothetical protein